MKLHFFPRNKILFQVTGWGKTCERGWTTCVLILGWLCFGLFCFLEWETKCLWVKTAESFLTLGLAGREIQYPSKQIQLRIQKHLNWAGTVHTKYKNKQNSSKTNNDSFKNKKSTLEKRHTAPSCLSIKTICKMWVYVGTKHKDKCPKEGNWLNWQMFWVQLETSIYSPQF